MIKQLLFFLLLLVPITANGQGEQIHLTGNSLLWQIKAWNMGVDLHIKCGSNLDSIYHNPTVVCVESSYLWIEAFVNETYDLIVVEPFHGTTLQQDVAIITEWMELQPQAQFVLYMGWYDKVSDEGVHFIDTYLAGNPDDNMRANPQYMAALADQLPRDVRLVPTGTALYQLYLDDLAGVSPYSYDDAWADDIHLNPRMNYVMRELTEWALGRPPQQTHQYFGLTSAERAYGDDLVWRLVRGNCNRDGSLDLLDVDAFVELLAAGQPDISADANCDGNVDLNDVIPFIELIAG